MQLLHDKYPQLAKNPLYLASESQGSQYAFPLSAAIIEHNEHVAARAASGDVNASDRPPLNLQGVTNGNGRWDECLQVRRKHRGKKSRNERRTKTRGGGGGARRMRRATVTHRGRRAISRPILTRRATRWRCHLATIIIVITTVLILLRSRSARRPRTTSASSTRAAARGSRRPRRR